MRLSIVVLFVILIHLPPALGAEPINPSPKVPLAFNRLYNVPDLEAALKQLAAAHPNLLTLTSVGKSVEGRNLWCMVINNRATGDDRAKAAMYVDGNVHGNEVQASEACLYLIWYLTENYARPPKIRQLVDERAFYVLPTVNPDGRAYWFDAPNTEHSSRSGKAPLDEDRDGLFDEDGYDDLNGDGQITEMRMKVKGGPFKLSPNDPRQLIPVEPGEQGDYQRLGLEGIDNDGDGAINEDPPGGYDMNRNWPADWQPRHLQIGAGDYPLCWPETRSIARFILDHPNIAGVQSFHNAGGMILRGPGDPSRASQYPREDDAIAKQIAAVGVRQIPGYRNLVWHRDLYQSHGGFICWTYEHLGIFSFTNELWDVQQLMGAVPSGAPRLGSLPDADALFTSDRLLFGADVVPWKPYKHPVYGDIEIGGTVRQLGWRIPPSFMLEEMCHRNAAFVIYHADQMPLVEIHDLKAVPLSPGVYAVTVTLKNTRSIPSISQQAARSRVGLPDRLSLTGEGLTVAAGGSLINRDTGEIQAEDRNPQTLRLDGGVGSYAVARYRWIVRARPNTQARVKFESQKAGSATESVRLN